MNQSHLVNQISNINIKSFDKLVTPLQLQELYPITEKAKNSVMLGRSEVKKILDKKDKRLIVVCGPCSISDIDSGFAYAQKLNKLKQKLADELLIIMRVYFEKPRTTVGWKGLINDPHLDDSFDINFGLKQARKFLIQINELGLSCASEALDPISPQYLDDLFSWMAIGARTTESQTHREMASGLSMPVGFKNGTDGNISIAINAITSAQNPHSFLGINEKGSISIVNTLGNQYAHIILRGGKEPNYSKEHIKETEDLLRKNGIAENIVVDCSHSNSYKNYKIQPVVAEEVIEQITQGNKSICGLMFESNLFEGNQSINKDKSKMKYGVSVTDACMGFEATEKMLVKIAKNLKNS